MKLPASHHEGVHHEGVKHLVQQIAIAERRLALFKQREREKLERKPLPVGAKRRK
jgi:hypothetical protein